MSNIHTSPTDKKDKVIPPHEERRGEQKLQKLKLAVPAKRGNKNDHRP